VRSLVAKIAPRRRSPTGAGLAAQSKLESGCTTKGSYPSVLNRFRDFTERKGPNERVLHFTLHS
jgi:hypothetical protein